MQLRPNKRTQCEHAVRQNAAIPKSKWLVAAIQVGLKTGGPAMKSLHRDEPSGSLRPA